MERFFKLKERGTNVCTELIAGMTTFFSMVYILMVNADMFAYPGGDMSNPLGVSYGAIYIATAISAVVGTVLAIIIMSHKKVGGAVLIGIIGGMAMYYLLGLTVPGFYAGIKITMISPLAAFREFGELSLGKVFTEGFDFSAYAQAHGTANLILTTWIIGLLFVAMLVLTH